MTSRSPVVRPPAQTMGSAPGSTAMWRAVRDLEALAPDLGWPEATVLTDAVVEALAQRCADLAVGRDEPTSRPLVPGVPTGDAADRAVDHASCRAAAARLRGAATTLGSEGADRAWVLETAAVATELADLLDQIAGRSRAGRVRPSDKGVVLRRLYALHRRLH